MAVLTFTLPASADEYQIYKLHFDQGYNFFGMDDADQVVITGGACGPNYGLCYYSYVDGVYTGTSSQAPTFTVDDGTQCSPSVPTNYYVFYGVCNNGREAFSALTYLGQLAHPSLYAGPEPIEMLAQNVGGDIYENASGDIVFDDTAYDIYYEAVDLGTSPVPEVSTIILLGTGLLALLVMCRQKRTALGLQRPQ